MFTSFSVCVLMSIPNFLEKIYLIGKHIFWHCILTITGVLCRSTRYLVPFSLTLIFLILGLSHTPLLPPPIPIPSVPRIQTLLFLCPLHDQCWQSRPGSPSSPLLWSPTRQSITLCQNIKIQLWHYFFLFQFTLVVFSNPTFNLNTNIHVTIKNQKSRCSRRVKVSILVPDMPLTNHLMWLQAL